MPMLTFATDLINGAALWKIILVSLVAGGGVTIAFGLLLLGLEQADVTPGPASGSTTSGGTRVAGFGLSTIAALFCVAAVAFGVYAMVKKPSSKKPTKSKSALVIEHTAYHRSLA
jgi:hypothetical protein